MDTMISPETRFLIAASDAEERSLISAVLNERGYHHVVAVDDGPTALGLLESGRAFYIIVAWELPRLGGMRLVKEALRLRPGERPDSIFIVPKDCESEKAMAQEVSPSGFFIRPLNPSVAGAELDRILNSDDREDWPRAATSTGDTLMEDGRFKEAEAVYEKALESGRQRLSGLNTEMGKILLQMGRLTEAIDVLEQAALADPTLPRAQEALGQAYMEANRPAEAARAWERALKNDPQNTLTKTHLAESLLQSGHPDRAAALFKDILDINPADKHILNLMGIALRKQGRYESAVEHYQRALRIVEQDEHLLFNLGRCYLETGQHQNAMDTMRRALNVNPEFDPARDMLEKLRKNQAGK
jgi:tetratricopeptide (TPR) repeat protein